MLSTRGTAPTCRMGSFPQPSVFVPTTSCSYLTTARFHGLCTLYLVRSYLTCSNLVINILFYHRLRTAGLLPFARLVERYRHRSARFPVDRALLFAWVDRWRPEMHTFHLPVGEVTITLQDIAMLFCLPFAGAPVGPVVVPGD